LNFCMIAARGSSFDGDGVFAACDDVAAAVADGDATVG
jgi:hypothetical protein